MAANNTITVDGSEGTTIVKINGKDHLICVARLNVRDELTSKGNRTIATSGGNQVTDARYEGKAVTLGFTAYVKG